MSDTYLSSQPTEKELRRSYWFITHIPFFKRLSLWALIGFNVLLGLIVVGVLFNFYALQYSSYKGVFTSMVTGITSGNPNLVSRAQDLSAPRVGVIAHNDSAFDVYAQVVNSNTSWWGEFSYVFTVNGRELPAQKGFIMPGETKYFMQLSLNGAPPSNGTIDFKDLSWHHVSAADLAYLKERVDFSVSDWSFTSPRDSGVSQTVPVARGTFTLKNNSGYSYWSVGLPIVLKNGDQVVGVSYLSADTILPGDKRTIEARWFQQIDGVSGAEIRPSVNVFDKRVFRPVQGVQPSANLTSGS